MSRVVPYLDDQCAGSPGRVLGLVHTNSLFGSVFFFSSFFFLFLFLFFLGVHGFHIHGFYTERARLAGVELQHSTCKTEYESGGYAFSLFFLFLFVFLMFFIFLFLFLFLCFLFSFYFRCTRLPHTRLPHRTCKTSWGRIPVYTASAHTASIQNVQD